MTRWLAIAPAVALLAASAGARADEPAVPAKGAAEARPLDARRLQVAEDVREALRRFELAAMGHAEKLEKPGKARNELTERLLGEVVERRRALAAVLEAQALASSAAPVRRAAGLALAAGLQMDVFDSVSRVADALGMDPDQTRAPEARSEAIRLWSSLVELTPRYRDLGQVLDQLSQAYYDIGEYEQAKRTLQRMLCANRDAELAAAATAVDNADDGVKARVYAQSVGVDDYGGCKPRVSDPELVADAWLRLGYLHRTGGAENHLAVSAYEQVIDSPGAPGYFVALQEQAATFVELGQLLEAIPPLDALIEYLDRSIEENGDDEGLEPIRAEAVQRIGTILAQLWRESAVPDPDASLELALIYFRGRLKQTHVRAILEELGVALRRFGAFDQAVPVWRHVLTTWPGDPRAPTVHARIVALLVEKGDQRTADEERNKLIAAFGPDSSWRKLNAANQAAVLEADELAAETMFTLASSLYRRALSQISTSKVADRALLDEAIAMNLAVVDRFPRSKRGYQASYQLGEVLFHRGRFIDAAQRFRRVRGLDASGRHFSDATRRMVAAYERAADQAEAEGSLVRPPIPTKQTLIAKASTPVTVPPLLRELQRAYDAYAEVVAGDNETASLAYKAALIDLTHFRLQEAEKRLDAVVTEHCQSPIAKSAAERLAELSEARGERSLRSAAQNLVNRACGDSRPVQLARQARVKQALADGERLVAQGRPLEAGRRLYAAHADTTAADPLHDDTLFRAAEAFAAARRGEVALQLLEAFDWQPALQQSELYAPALWLAGQTYESVFDDEAAVDAYLRLAQLGQQRGYKAVAGFDLSSRASDGLWRAAELRELDRVFYDRGPGDPGAASLFKRYAAVHKQDRERASAAYLRAAAVLQAAGDTAALERTYGEWNKALGKQREVARYHVRFNHLVGKARIVAGDPRGAGKAFEAVIKAYETAGLKPGSDEALLAAEAQFWRAEEVYQRVLMPYEFRWPDDGEEKELQKRVEALGKVGEEAEKAFNAVLAFDTEWSIAATLRVGDVYLDVANKFISAPRPASVSKTVAIDVETFATMVTEAVQSVIDAAGEKWAKAVELARDRGTVNSWSKLAQQRLNTHLDASKYAVLREELIVAEETP
ncbi:MAG TPA: hypothetical protein VML75_23990 [Kofleriaceae bacterium]|nr:hypothetical protein [Kofleriaceae bacterium]